MIPIPIPYEVVSVSTGGRAMEWKLPLWEAIHDFERAVTMDQRMRAVARVEEAVEQAMRLALEVDRRRRDSEPDFDVDRLPYGL